MITERNLQETLFFTHDGTDIWKNCQVRTVRQVLLKNLDTGDECIAVVGDDAFTAVKMPDIKAPNTPRPQKPDTKPEQPVNNAHKSHKSKSTSKKKTSNRNTSQYKGVERLKPNKSGQVKFKVSWWNAKTKKNIYLGTHDSELIAAAAFQDHIGNKAEVAKLRAQAKQQTAGMAEQQENNPDRPLDGADRHNLKRLGKTYWVCNCCGLEYQSKGQCAGCGNFDMRKFSGENGGENQNEQTEDSVS